MIVWCLYKLKAEQFILLLLLSFIMAGEYDYGRLVSVSNYDILVLEEPGDIMMVVVIFKCINDMI
ncbi:hypothetical protein DERF_002720 [Dermatophagoides farinae]|uniref:Uncharacterized protein n=1 Tax=Dermatophagoides farinae TaxID=6954 RepID=A0A922LDD9_DERFA|nr:hypothetical protein DERF_002720 [Dermatophagoides farinae]